MPTYHTYRLPGYVRQDLLDRGIDMYFGQDKGNTLDWLRGAAMAGLYEHFESWEGEGEGNVSKDIYYIMVQCGSLSRGDIIIIGTEMFVINGDHSENLLPRYPLDDEDRTAVQVAAIFKNEKGISAAEAAVLQGLFESGEAVDAAPEHVLLLDTGLLEAVPDDDGSRVRLSTLGRDFVAGYLSSLPVYEGIIEPPQETTALNSFRQKLQTMQHGREETLAVDETPPRSVSP